MKHSILQNQCSHAVRLCTAICLGMMAVATCFAQTEVVSFTTLDDPIQKTLIRSYNYPDVISYVETATRHAFIYTDMQTFHQIGDINPDFEVNDYALWNDTVYFCGKTTIGTTSYGILGYFRCSDFFTFPGHYFFQTFLPSDTAGNHVTNLSRLVCYRDIRNILHMVAIGTESANDNSCIVDFLPTTTSPNNYTVGIVDKQEWPFNKIRDITCTDDYLVASGFYLKQPDEGIALRLFDKNRLFPLGGMQDSLHTYSYASLHKMYSTDNFPIVHIYGNLVATTVYEKDPLSPNLYDGTQISLFDANDVRYNLPYGMSINMELQQPYASIGNWKLLELRNDPANQALLLLQKTEHGLLPGQFIHMVNEIGYAPGPMPTTIPGTFIPKTSLQSIDVHKAVPSPTRYFTDGYSLSQPYDMYYMQRMPLNENSCTKPLKFPIRSIDIEYQKREPSPLTLYSTHLYVMRYLSFIDDSIIEIECDE